MSELVYPWRWLAEGVGEAFSLRYPWADEVRAAAGRSGASCLLLPEVAGPLSDWANLAVDWTARDGHAPCLASGGSFEEATRTLCESYGIGEPYREGRPAEWARRFLVECRREMPQVDAVPLIVPEADDTCSSSLLDLVRAQRDLGYEFARPMLLRRTTPPGWGGNVVRFGLPDLVGNLDRIAPSPEREPESWTRSMIALIVIWEAGATPHLADELWERLCMRQTLSLRDSEFDRWVGLELDAFAVQSQSSLDLSLPSWLAFEPAREVEDKLWQAGAVAWQDDHFDVTPLRARLWIKSLGDGDARDSLRRRRLTNVPLARWLAAWATSVEESLRIAALQAGSLEFRGYLETQPPRDRRNRLMRSRLEELNVGDGETLIDRADFGDLAGFVSQRSPRSGATNRSKMLELCRQARNRVVHQRLFSTGDFLHIAYASCWLR